MYIMFSKTKVDFERQPHLRQKLTSYVGSLKILLPNFDLHLTQPQPTFQTLFAKPFWISIASVGKNLTMFFGCVVK